MSLATLTGPIRLILDFGGCAAILRIKQMLTQMIRGSTEHISTIFSGNHWRDQLRTRWWRFEYVGTRDLPPRRIKLLQMRVILLGRVRRYGVGEIVEVLKGRATTDGQ